MVLERIKEMRLYKIAVPIYRRFHRKIGELLSKYSILYDKKYYKVICNLRMVTPIPMFKYLKSGNGQIRILNNQNIMKYYFYDCLEGTLTLKQEIFDKSPDYVGVLENVILVPDSMFVVKDGDLLSDKFYYSPESAYIDLHYLCYAHSNDKIIYATPKKEKKYIERAIDLRGSTCGVLNYWHLVFEILPRLYYFDYLDQFEDWPILIDESILKTKWSFGLLEKYNQKRRKYIFADEKTEYTVGKLAVSSPAIFMRNIQETYVFEFPDEVLNYSVRKLHTNRKKSDIRRKFYIYRNDGRLTNEKDLVFALKKIGIEILRPEEYPLDEEIELFENAKLVIGVWGAGFTNTIMCPKDCKVIQICTSKRLGGAAMFAHVSLLTGFEFHCVLADTEEDKGIGTPGIKLKVNIDSIVQLCL